MRVVLAPNAFKGSFDAVEVARAWEDAVADRSDVDVDLRPMSDGGDGFVAIVRFHRPGTLAVSVLAPDPLGRSRRVVWGWDPEREAAYLESAAAIGLGALGPDERDPLRATTEGLGRTVRAAAALRARQMVIGLGGSATVDGGLGMARALGYRFEGDGGEAIARPADLPALRRIVPPDDPPARGTEVTALVDVEHPLLGPRGAAATFAPQKGADEAAVSCLEEGLGRLAERWVADLGVAPDLAGSEGAGAAGGLGAGCRAFLGARIAKGAAWCAGLGGVAAALAGADAVVTGEGVWDAQSTGGKATGWVVEQARRLGLPVVVACAGAEREPPPGAAIVTAETIGRANESLDLAGIAALGARAIEALLPRRG